jgi:predicted TIM-barrel fold metal-dependent hydrolase
MTAAAGPSPLLGVLHKAPAFAVPPGACDCHTHVFGPPSQYPYCADRTYMPGLASADDLLALQARLGLDRVVIVQPSPYGSDNRCTVDALLALGVRARGVAVIDEATTDAELHRMHAAGVRGVRVNLETHGVSDSAAASRQLARTGERVAALGWHLQVFTNLSVLAGLAPTIRSLPQDVVLDHFAKARADAGTDQPGFGTLLDLLAGGRVWIKLSAPQRIADRPDDEAATRLARALIAARPDRMLWGSDWPHPGAHPGVRRDPHSVEAFHAIDDGHALDRLQRWTTSEAELRAILVDNPARLYDFEPRNP